MLRKTFKFEYIYRILVLRFNLCFNFHIFECYYSPERKNFLNFELEHCNLKNFKIFSRKFYKRRNCTTYISLWYIPIEQLFVEL